MTNDEERKRHEDHYKRKQEDKKKRLLPRERPNKTELYKRPAPGTEFEEDES